MKIETLTAIGLLAKPHMSIRLLDMGGSYIKEIKPDQALKLLLNGCRHQAGGSKTRVKYLRELSADATPRVKELPYQSCWLNQEAAVAWPWVDRDPLYGELQVPS